VTKSLTWCGRECDIVETLHMRLTLLQMTFGKHIERKHICFFPGEVRPPGSRLPHFFKNTVLQS
jgi:F-box protein 28